MSQKILHLCKSGDLLISTLLCVHRACQCLLSMQACHSSSLLRQCWQVVMQLELLLLHHCSCSAGRWQCSWTGFRGLTCSCTWSLLMSPLGSWACMEGSWNVPLESSRSRGIACWCAMVTNFAGNQTGSDLLHHGGGDESRKPRRRLTAFSA